MSVNDHEKVLKLEVLRGGWRAGAGRPLRFTARAFIRICRSIQRGASAVDACDYEGVAYESLRRHVKRNSKFQRRLKLAEEIREHYLREFHIANLQQHSLKSVAASMFWLERRFPDEFALRTVIRNTGERGESAVFNRISLEQLVENVRLASEIAASPPPGLALPAAAPAESEPGLSENIG